MSEEIIVYRFGDYDIIPSKQVMEYHFEHLDKNKTMLFTTSSIMSANNQEGRTIIFTDKDKNKCFKAKIIDSGQFDKQMPNLDEFMVPEEFEDVLGSEIQSGYKWFALKSGEEIVSYEDFGKGLYRLSRTDVYDSLGENQTPFRYVIPINK